MNNENFVPCNFFKQVYTSLAVITGVNLLETFGDSN